MKFKNPKPNNVLTEDRIEADIFICGKQIVIHVLFIINQLF